MRSTTTEPTTDQITPGQWCTSRDAVPEWHVQIAVYAEDTGKRVATVFETEANAHAIAAVPDLIAALERAEYALSAVAAVGVPEALSIVRSALRKAAGDQ